MASFSRLKQWNWIFFFPTELKQPWVWTLFLSEYIKYKHSGIWAQCKPCEILLLHAPVPNRSLWCFGNAWTKLPIVLISCPHWLVSNAMFLSLTQSNSQQKYIASCGKSRYAARSVLCFDFCFPLPISRLSYLASFSHTRYFRLIK